MSQSDRSTRAGRLPSGRGWMFPAFLIAFAAVLPKAALGNASGPLAGLTGGFGETTCSNCHSAHGANDGRALGGVFQIDGAPRGYQPGKSYAITVVIAHPGQSRWGFQLSARFADSGKQAGTWSPADRMTQVRTESEIQYAMQTAEGSRDGVKDGPIEFRVNWIAPQAPGGLIIFNATGNAADASDSPAGDFIYTAGNFSRPAAAAQQEPEPIEVDAAPVSGPTRQQETSRIADLPSPVDLKRGTVEIHIQHRFLDSVADAGAGNAWGIDSGANINLGMNVGISDRLSAGVARTRFEQIVELSGTYEIRTARQSNWKLALRAGVEGKENFQREYSPFVQLAGAFDYKQFRLNVVPTMTFNSRSEQMLEFNRPDAINPESNNTFALGLGADFALNPRYSLTAEYAPRLAGFGGFFERCDQVAAGFVVRTWGHVFTVLLSTSRDFTPAKYGVNAEYRNLSLGFNVYRRMR